MTEVMRIGMQRLYHINGITEFTNKIPNDLKNIYNTIHKSRYVKQLF